MKVLAVSTNCGDPRPYVEQEAAHLATLTSAGLVTDAWLKADWSGAVLLLDVADLATARGTVERLPLAAHGVTTFALTPVVDLPASG